MADGQVCSPKLGPKFLQLVEQLRCFFFFFFSCMWRDLKSARKDDEDYALKLHLALDEMSATWVAEACGVRIRLFILSGRFLRYGRSAGHRHSCTRGCAQGSQFQMPLLDSWQSGPAFCTSVFSACVTAKREGQLLLRASLLPRSL